MVTGLTDWNPDTDDRLKLMGIIGESGAVLVTALDEISPPDGLGEHHAATVTYYHLSAIVARFLSGSADFSEEEVARLQEMREDDVDPPRPSPEVHDRVAQAAIGVPECYGSGLLLSFLGGGQ